MVGLGLGVLLCWNRGDFHPGEVKGARAALPQEGNPGWRGRLNPPGEETTTKWARKKTGGALEKAGMGEAILHCPADTRLGKLWRFSPCRARPGDGEGEERHSPGAAAGAGKAKPAWTRRGKSEVIGPKIKAM